jgi:lipopolysaccharide export system ATP-binding protein
VPVSRLTFLRVTKAYGTRAVLNGVSLSVSGGAIHALEGSNGSGKTTLFEIAAGFLHADGGLIVLESDRTSSITLNYRPPNTRVADGVVYIPQVCRALGGLSTFDNLKIAYGLSRNQGSEARAAIFGCLEELHLTRLLDRRPADMNQSDQLFLALAQAYLRNPLFLMIDEPLPGVSGPDLKHFMAILRRFRDLGTGILVTGHNPRAILEIADTVSVLSNGVIAYSAGTREAVNA